MGPCIPLWLLQDLKCRHCKNFLSCGPVYVTPDCGLLCGRCKALAKPNFRNYVFEELASTFTFPCLNWERYCPAEGSWNTLKEHELDCEYGGSCRLICVDPGAFFSSKRTLPNEENLLYLEVPEKCLNLVSCKNCGKYLSCEPVHINVVGSNICHRCYLSNGVPPHTLRNLAYEKLANIFRFPCIFRARGCPVKFKFGRNSWEHEVACHYRDVQISSTPPTPVIDPGFLHPFNEIDNSGYRLSVEGASSSPAYLSYDKDKPMFELPRVSSILRNQAEQEMKSMQQRKNEERQAVMKDFRGKNTKDNNQTFYSKIADQSVCMNCEKGDCNGHCLDKERITDKERGIVPTHTGHVYATLTQNSILFAPPQIQPNKDPSNGIKVTKEFQDKLRRAASNASQTDSQCGKKIRNSFSAETKGPPLGYQVMENNGNGLFSSALTETSHNIHTSDFSGLNKHQVKDLQGFNGEFAPVLKEYVQYNPQNNVQRNESLTIGNPDIIAELKVRNAQRRKKQDENSNDIKVY